MCQALAKAHAERLGGKGNAYLGALRCGDGVEQGKQRAVCLLASDLVWFGLRCEPTAVAEHG